MPRDSRAGLLATVVLVAFGVLDRLAGQMQAQTLGPYIFIKTPLNSVAYFVAYYAILLGRLWFGPVTPTQLRFMYTTKLDPPLGGGPPGTWRRLGAWKLLLIAGLGDCLSEVMSLTAQPYVRGVLYVLLPQGLVLAIVFWSVLLLHRRYSLRQYLAVLVAVAGSALAALGSDWEESSPWYAALEFLSVFPSALSFVLKEKAFRDYELWQGGRPESTHGAQRDSRLDVFVVCSAAALFQLVSVPLVIPGSSEITNTDNVPMLQWWGDAMNCLRNDRPSSLSPGTLHKMPHVCTGAWQMYLLYVFSNLGLNVSMYVSITYGSAVWSFLASKMVGPISEFLFLFDWPLIGRGSLSPMQGAATALIPVGVVLFRCGSGDEATATGGGVCREVRHGDPLLDVAGEGDASEAGGQSEAGARARGVSMARRSQPVG